jgi:hypothetical protein
MFSSSSITFPFSPPAGNISFKNVPKPAAFGFPFLGNTKIAPFFLQQKHSAVFSEQSSHSQYPLGETFLESGFSANILFLHCSWNDR